MRYNEVRILIEEITVLAETKELYAAEYLGSGTFIIKKPSRKKHKLRQSRVKKLRAGMRK